MATVETEAPARAKAAGKQLLPPPTAGRASPRLYAFRDHVRYGVEFLAYTMRRIVRGLETGAVSRQDGRL